MGTPWRSQIRMIRWVRAAVRSWVRPGNAGESHSSRPSGIGDYLHVHAMPAVLVGVVGLSVADPVAFGERAVKQDEVRIGLAQDLQQTRRAVGEQVDDGAGVGVSGGLADPKPANLGPFPKE